jgi:hypothetical protein
LIQACTGGGGFCQCPHQIGDPTTIKFRPRPALDVLTSHARELVDGTLDVVGSGASWLLTNAGGSLMTATIPSGAFVANANGTSFRYRNGAARTAGGVYKATIRAHRGFYAYRMQAYGDLSAATSPEMSLQFYVGNQSSPAIHTEVWSKRNFGWRASNPN